MIVVDILTADGQIDDNLSGTLYIAELKEDGTLHKMKKVEYPFTSKYYIYEPTEGAKSIRLFFWDRLVPMSGVKSMKNSK